MQESKKQNILDYIESLQKQIEDPIPFKEAAKYLNFSESYLYKLTSNNLIPFFKPTGKKIFFLKSQLREWITKSPNKTNYELEQEAINYVMFGGRDEK